MQLPLSVKEAIRNKAFLVTGAAGFIGSHVSGALLAAGASKVRALDNLATGHLRNIEQFLDLEAFEFVEGDICDQDVCLSAVQGIDGICHQAAIGSVPRSIEDPIYSNAANINGYLNLLEAARRSRIRRFVYASSSSVYGDEKSLPKIESQIGNPLSPYAVTKQTDELYAGVYGRIHDMETIGLRYFNVFGPRQDPDGPYAAVIPRFVEHMLKGEPVYIDGDGEQTRDFTYIENVVQINLLGLTTSNLGAFNRAYNVACGENFSIKDLHQRIAKMLKVDKEAVHREARAGDIRDSLADIGQARKLLGYQPKVSFEQGLALTVSYFKERFQSDPLN